MKRINLIIIFYIVIVSIFSNKTYAQIITTIAGNADSLGFVGDGGAATLAGIGGPDAVARDNAGNLYIADRYNNRIRKVNYSTGVITTVAGNGIAGYSGNGGQATAAKLNNPTGVAVDAAGNLYISDGNGSGGGPPTPTPCVRKVNTAGIITLYAGNTVAGYSGDGGQATAAKLVSPVGLALDHAGNLYIADNSGSVSYSNVIRKVSPSGIITTVAGSGTSGYSGDGGPATAALIHAPSAVAIDPLGNLYIADCNNYCVRKVNTSGVISTVGGIPTTSGFSGDGGPATSAKMNWITGIAVDTNGIIYVSEYINNRIRKIYKTGVIYTLVGNGTPGYAGDGGISTLAEINQPYGITLDDSDNVYIADYANNVVRKSTDFINHKPHFVGGDIQNFAVCENTTYDSMNHLLAVNDTDGNQIVNWSVLLNPSHGVMTSTYSATSTSGVLIPTGLVYTSTTGYMGGDTFKVVVTDGIDFDTTTIYVNVSLPILNAGVITGSTDSACPANTVNLTDTVAGGIWSSSSLLIATVNATGTVTAVNSGTDTIKYSVLGCNTVVANFTFTTKTLAECFIASTPMQNKESANLQIYPNPNSGSFVLGYNTLEKEQIYYKIFNTLGQLIKEGNIDSNIRYDLNIDAPNGVYYLSITTHNGTLAEKFSIYK